MLRSLKDCFSFLLLFKLKKNFKLRLFRHIKENNSAVKRESCIFRYKGGRRFTFSCRQKRNCVQTEIMQYSAYWVNQARCQSLNLGGGEFCFCFNLL